MLYFKGSVALETRDENDKSKTVKKDYVFQAVNYTDAETFLTQQLEETGESNFDITNIGKIKLNDVFISGEDTQLFFKCKVQFETENDKGKKKYIKDMILVDADDAEQAYKTVFEHFKESLMPYTIPNVDIIKITDYLER